MLSVGSLFSGIGGFDLGLERAGMKVIWQSEIDPYASAVLKKHWPHVPNHGDIRTIRAGNVDRPDVLCGGFPCNDISNAGRRKGLAGEQSGLWREMSRVVLALAPEFVIVENSAHGIRHWLQEAVDFFASANFSTAVYNIAASDIGANHERRRCFVLADACGRRLQASHEAIQAGRASSQLHPWWASEPEIYRVDDGIPNAVDRRRVLGRAVVPQIAEIIGRAIIGATE